MLNPSFEDTLTGTDGYPFLVTDNWWNPNGFSTDYFTPYCEELCCGTVILHCAGEVDYLGYQLAQDSASYMGIVIYETTGDTKEYGQGFLSEPMQASTDYCVGIWIALADSSSFLSCDFQVAFTTDLIQGSQLNNLFLQEYVAFDISGINDSIWTYFEGTYTANGGEQYIYLGSNTPNNELTCVEELGITWLNNACYILVDNLSVKETTLCSTGLHTTAQSPQSVIYPNPVDDQLFISGLGISRSVVNLFDSSNRLCGTWVETKQEFSVNVSSLEQGIYYLVIEQEYSRYTSMIIKR